ncbi:hypothetical protein [Microcoleus sp. FACHB-672]|uniref:hypothetical protein n=1 Tax=Microcoleus sp. FACHB-672 TaxID=2692825 RepID=UPI001686E004|nr:hypothetical protein [Microcoleus sp. FACHB-672]MBD2041770.1 hypothetical protein [Microcoleus sp. FACHB-672]
MRPFLGPATRQPETPHQSSAQIAQNAGSVQLWTAPQKPLIKCNLHSEIQVLWIQ